MSAPNLYTTPIGLGASPGGTPFGTIIYDSQDSTGLSGQVLTANGDSSTTWQNGASSTLPATYVGFGSGTNQLTGDSGLTYGGDGVLFIGNGTGTLGTLHISDGTFGTGSLEIAPQGPGEPVDLIDESGFNLVTSGPLELNGSAGTDEQVLTSQGPGLPPIWANQTGGVPAASVFVGDLDCDYPTELGVVTCFLDMGQISDPATNYIFLGVL